MLSNAMERFTRQRQFEPQRESGLYLLRDEVCEELDTGEDLSNQETGWRSAWDTEGQETGYEDTSAHQDTGAGAFAKLKEGHRERAGGRVAGKITRLEHKAARLGVAPRVAAMTEEITERQILVSKKKVENDIKFPDWQPFGLFQPQEVAAAGTVISNTLITRDMFVKHIFFAGTTDLFRITRFSIQGGPMFQGANLSPSIFTRDNFALKELELNMRLPVNAQIGLDVLNFTAATPGSISCSFFGYMIPASQGDYRGA